MDKLKYIVSVSVCENISEVSFNFHSLILFIVIYGALWRGKRRVHAYIADRAK